MSCAAGKAHAIFRLTPLTERVHSLTGSTDTGHNAVRRCCGFDALNSSCVPPARRAPIMLIRNPLDQMLSSFFFYRSFNNPKEYPQYSDEAVRANGAFCNTREPLEIHSANARVRSIFDLKYEEPIVIVYYSAFRLAIAMLLCNGRSFFL